MELPHQQIFDEASSEFSLFFSRKGYTVTNNVWVMGMNNFYVSFPDIGVPALHQYYILDHSIMNIFVKMPEGRTISLVVEPSDTTEIVKAKIHEKENISPELQQLSFDGNPLVGDGLTLSNYDIHGYSTLFLDLTYTYTDSRAVLAKAARSLETRPPMIGIIS